MNRDESLSKFLGRVRARTFDRAAALQAASRVVVDDQGQPVTHNFGGHIDLLQAHWRCEGLSPRVLQAILADWRPPSWADVEAVWSFDEVLTAADRYSAAAAAVVVETAVYGGIVQSRDPLAFRQVTPGPLPEQAQQLLPAAREALTVFARAYLGHLGTQEEGAGLLDYLPPRPTQLNGAA